MFKNYKLINNNLYVSIDNYTEFSSEFYNKPNPSISIRKQITDYILDNDIKYYTGKVFIIHKNVAFASVTI